MKKLIFTLISICNLMAFSPLASAAWYEVIGSAAIVATEKQAELNALEDAVYRAVRFSGADVGAVRNIFPLLTANKKEFQFTNHEVRYIQVEAKQTQNGTVYIKIKIDIYPSASACHTGQYKKTLLIDDMTLLSPQQAVIGQMYDLGTDFSTLLSNQLDKQSASFLSVGTADYAIDKSNPTRIQMIAEDKGAQYVVAGNITDLSATIAERGGDDLINRQFALEMQIFDGKTGNEIATRNYREVARWPFPKTSKVDTRSARFWSSTYGEMLQRVSRNMMLDLENELACKITLPEVVAKFGNTVTINLGRLHGVRVGDKLSLWHTGSFIDQHGISRNKVSQSDITLTVTRVYEHDAELSIDQPDLADSVQIGDVMNKQM